MGLNGNDGWLLVDRIFWKILAWHLEKAGASFQICIISPSFRTFIGGSKGAHEKKGSVFY